MLEAHVSVHKGVLGGVRLSNHGPLATFFWFAACALLVVSPSAWATPSGTENLGLTGARSLTTAATPLAVHAVGPLFGVGDSFGISPFEDWKVIETEHFRITFPAALTESAQRAARFYEEAHTFLSHELVWESRNRVPVLLLDNTDSANGVTSPVERLGMILQITPPENWFSTTYYDDWLRLLIIHEYTHYLNMDATRGVWELLRTFFGDTLLPTSVWPSWMLEGLAVYMETRHTQSGRGRSPYFEMILRTAVAEGKLDTSQFVKLNRLGGGQPWFPGGETSYLFGFGMIDQLVRSGSTPAQGMRQLSALTYHSSFRIPYLLNGNVENVSGKTWYQHWGDFMARTRAQADLDLAQIRSIPMTPLQPLTHGGFTTLGAAASPDGRWLAYTQDTIDLRSKLYLRDLETGQVYELGDKSMGATMAFTPNSRHLILSALRQSGAYESWSDLEIVDISGGPSPAANGDTTAGSAAPKSSSAPEPGFSPRFERRQLSRALRAKDPDVSQDGKYVVFTLTDQATTGLGWAELIRADGQIRLGTVKRLYWPSAYDRIATPKFAPAGDRIVFSLHRAGRLGEDLMELHLSAVPIASAAGASGATPAIPSAPGNGILALTVLLPSATPATLVQDGANNRFPAFDAHGELYYVSDRTGVDNLFHLDQAARSELYTNVTGGIWLPTFGPKGVYASTFGLSGWDVSRITLADRPIDEALVHLNNPTLTGVPRAAALGATAYAGTATEIAQAGVMRPATGNLPGASTGPTDAPPPTPVASPTPRGSSTPVGSPTRAIGPTPDTPPAPTAVPTPIPSSIPTPSPVPSPAPIPFPVEDYTIFPSILPRTWGPYALVVPDEGSYVGAYATGFDEVDRHRYFVTAAYDFRAQQPNFLTLYSNRSLGVTLTGVYEDRTQSRDDEAGFAYERTTTFSGAASYPIRWTYSTLTPEIDFSAERRSLYIPSVTTEGPVARAAFYPSLDFGLSYSSVESSRLAFTSEAGLRLLVGSRLYLADGDGAMKHLITATDFLRLGDHVVLEPALKGSWTSGDPHQKTPVLLSGRSSNIFGSLYGDSFSQIGIRGYPLHDYALRAAIVSSLDVEFPIARIFAGPGTDPFFLEQLHGVAFLEGSWLPTHPDRQAYGVSVLGSTGGGLRLDTHFFVQVPLQFSVDYHYGFARRLGGAGELFFGINLGALGF